MLGGEFNSIKQKVAPKQILLAAFMCSGIEICEKDEGLIVNLNYIYGYELQLKYVADKNLKLISNTIEPGSSLAKKQFSYFVSKFEEADVIEICDRFLFLNDYMQWLFMHAMSIYRFQKDR